MHAPRSLDRSVSKASRRGSGAAAALLAALLLTSLLLTSPHPTGAADGAPRDAGTASASDFAAHLAAVDRALATNPHAVPKLALYACQARRDLAIRLERRGEEVRATRSLQFCFNLLGLTEEDVARSPDSVDEPARLAAAREKSRAAALAEYDRALELVPDVARGLEIYRSCAACHTPEGWGMQSGVVPQIAGQHRSVVIKQLADIRAGNRQNRGMLPYASIESIGGAQAVADVAAYIDTLEISVENGRGDGQDLELGEQLYLEHCARCHGPTGEGDAAKQVPRIQSQHYGYLVAQFELIRAGQRRNANPEMVAQIAGFGPRETQAVLDWVSRLEPPEELQAPPGWRNPDFARAGATAR